MARLTGSRICPLMLTACNPQSLLIVVNIVNGVISGTLWPFVAAVVVMACGGFGLYASKRGKFVVWAELLDQLNLSGDERILDMGCGRGAILLLAADRSRAAKEIAPSNFTAQARTP
jgi:arsenite methyltransferase